MVTSRILVFHIHTQYCTTRGGDHHSTTFVRFLQNVHGCLSIRDKGTCPYLVVFGRGSY